MHFSVIQIFSFDLQMGSVMTPERHYDVMTDSSARLQRSMEMRVLVTWTNAERMRRASKNDTDRSQENDEIIPKDNTLGK